MAKASSARLARQRAQRRGHPHHGCRARDPGAVEPQRRAHDRGRHRRPEPARAALRDGGVGHEAGRPAAVHRAWAASSRPAIPWREVTRVERNAKATFAHRRGAPDRARWTGTAKCCWCGSRPRRPSRRRSSRTAAATSTTPRRHDACTWCRAMRRGTFGRRILYWLTVAIGLALAIVPLPGWLDPLRPDLALLVVIYWSSPARASRDSAMRGWPDSSSTCCTAWCSASTHSASWSSRS